MRYSMLGHYCMARPQVADGADSLKICRVAANILNKQSQITNKGWPTIAGLGVDLPNPLFENKLVVKRNNWR
jgi:hypothetical protein